MHKASAESSFLGVDAERPYGARGRKVPEFVPNHAAAFAGRTARMGKLQTLQRVLDAGIVAVIRSTESDVLVDVAEALVAGGVEVMEVTFTVPHAVRVLERVTDQLGARALLGAGTVLDASTCRAALLAGAEFIVSPTADLDVIRMGQRYDKPVFPGAFTPTEVLAAWEAGADIVKVFPSDFVGPRYQQILHGPLPQVRLMPTGGVNLDTARAFLEAGACALGVGTALVDPQAIQRRDMSRLETLARQFADIVRQFRLHQA